MMIETEYPLRVLFWEATLRCNAGCDFCGSSCGAKAVDLDGETVVRALGRIAAAYPPDGIMVNVTGGEPLLRADLFEVMSRAHAMGFPWGIVTNGTLITDEVIRKMKQTGMRTISISIDGLGQQHEQIRKLPNSFPKIIRAIRRLAEEEFLTSIQITTVVTKRNLSALEEMYSFFSELPIDSWRIAPVDEIGRCEEQRQLLLDSEELSQLLRFLDRHSFDPLRILTSCSHYLGNADTLYRPYGFSCETGKTVASILADGSVYVCPNVPRMPELIQGNIQTDDFVTLWENGFRWFRDPDSRKCGTCAACPSWERCHGDSVHTWDFARQEPKFCWEKHAQTLPRDVTLPERILQAARRDADELTGVRLSYGSSSRKTVFFTPTAAEKLYFGFSWGKLDPMNLCEQMAGMIGFIEGEKVFVTDLIPVPLQDRGEDRAVFTDELHQYVRGELALYRENLPRCPDVLTDRNGQVFLLGYLHSHPLDQKTTMSIPDLELHRMFRAELSEDYMTGILNPQQKELCIYWDSSFSSVDVVLLCRRQRAERFE